MIKIKRSVNSDKNSALLLLLPAFVGLLLFYVIPFLTTLYYSFIDNIYTLNFIYFENYIKLFQNKSFMLAFKNTVVFLAIVLPVQLLLSFLLAYLLDRAVNKKNAVVSFFALPLVLPIGCFYFITQLFFAQNGIIAPVSELLGIGEAGLFQSDSIMLVVIFLYLWKYSGYTIILYLSALQFIPKEMYESAELDGIPQLKKLSRITVPLLTPITFSAFILAFSNSLRVFKEVYVIGGNYPKKNIYMLQHYINNVFTDLDYSKLSTATLLITACIIFIFVFWIKINNKYNGELL